MYLWVDMRMELYPQNRQRYQKNVLLNQIGNILMTNQTDLEPL